MSDNPSPEDPQHLPPPHHVPPPQPSGGMGEGAKLATGAGIGCGSYLLAILLFFVALPYTAMAGPIPLIVLMLVPVIVAIALMFSPRSRRVGLGMLIVAAAAWLVVIGPCIVILNLA